MERTRERCAVCCGGACGCPMSALPLPSPHVCAGNGISDAGATALAEALKTNNTVQTVDLGGMSCVCSWCCVVLEAAPLRAHLFWTVDGGSVHGPAPREGRAVVWDACLRGPVGVGAGAVLGGSSCRVSATCVDQEPFFRGRLVAGRVSLCVGCHAAPGGRAHGLGTSSPCLTTTTFSLISTTSRHAGFIHLLLRLYIRSDLCISAPPCVRQRTPPPVRVLCTPRPPLRAKSPRMPPFAAYRHSTPAAFTVTWVNKVGLPFLKNRAPSQTLSLRVYHMLMVFTISRLGLFVADNVAKPQTALACCTSKCHYSAYR